MLIGASMAARLHWASQGWKQTRPQIDGSGFSARMISAASRNLPAEISPT